MSISLVPQSQVKRTEAVKLYHLIQQIFPNVAVLGSHDFQNMLSVWREGSTFNHAILTLLNRRGRELTDEHFGTCVAQYFSEPISSCSDLVSYNQNIRDLLMGDYRQKDALYDILSEQFKPSVFDQTALAQYESQVLNFQVDIRYVMGNLYEKTIVKKINYNISSIYISYDFFKRLCMGDVCDYLASGIVDRILEDLENANMLEDYYKFLLYLSQIGKIDALRGELVKAGFYMSKYWEVHLQKYYQFANLSSEYPGIKSAIEAFIANYMHVCLQFADFLVSWFAASPQECKYIILPSSITYQQTLSVRYNLIIFTKMMKISTDSIQTKASLTDANVKDIETFAMNVLTNGSALTVETSIKLIAETVKYRLGDYYNQRNVGYILKALDPEQLQFSLIKCVLQVFENSLKYDNFDIIWLFVKSQKCMKFIKSQLCMPFDGDNCLHCQCLEIVYQMATKPKLILSFKEIGLFETLLEVVKKIPLLLTFVSKIILQVVEMASREKMLKIIPMGFVIQMVGILMEAMGDKKDIFMSSFLNGNNFPYINKQILINCLKLLHLLSRKQVRADKKFFEEDETGDFSLAIIKELVKLVLFLKDNEFGKKFIREKVELSGDEVLKVFKLIFVVGEELMKAHRGKSINLSRALFTSRNHLLASLYECLEYHELQNEYIPIFIEYDFRYSHLNKSFCRLLLSSITYQCFKTYVLQHYNQLRKREGETSVQTIYFVDDLTNQDIRNDHDFRVLVKKCLSKKQSQYRLTLKIMSEHQVERNYPSPARFGGRQGYSGPASVRISPHSRGTQQVGRTRSPFRQTGSTSYMSERSPGRVHMCENCKVVQCPNDRFCRNCNKL